MDEANKSKLPITDQPRYNVDSTQTAADSTDGGRLGQTDDSVCMDCCVCCAHTGTQCCDSMISWLLCIDFWQIFLECDCCGQCCEAVCNCCHPDCCTAL